MFSARDRRDGLPAEGAAAALQGFAVDKTFLTSLKGILLETELALTFVIFICFTASISAYMAAALLEFFITLAFLFLYATQYYLRFDRLNWPCLVRDSAPPHSGPLLLEGLPPLCQCHHHLPGGLLCSSDLPGWSRYCCFCVWHHSGFRFCL
ncbi:CKLF-like MARVEL transmembrane domain-containing protein 5 isoform X2 [Meles meles]|uniref:CKLF-like MARVEL transmembrane domain-containing protein 5 isoform X2 n=1 Tax=Meles meles TaxID=9662 RepID=UPI001E69D750|nr:CKLF-like MARVEL transmembrane domain-containing protein 5 isoform X2 [Meles meles]